MADGGRRSKNFSYLENEKLLELVEKYAYFIENRNSDPVSKKNKEEIWNNHIVEEFNSERLGPYRDVQTLQCKYQNLKKIARREEKNKSFNSTEGDPSSLDNYSTITEIMYERTESPDSGNKEQPEYLINHNINRQNKAALLEEQHKQVETVLDRDKEERDFKKKLLLEEHEWKKELYALQIEEVKLRIQYQKEEHVMKMAEDESRVKYNITAMNEDES